MLARPNNNKNVMGTLLPIEEGGQPSGFPWSHWEKYDFVTRLHYALVSLGAWEGRAVAFVLGECNFFFSFWGGVCEIFLY